MVLWGLLVHLDRLVHKAQEESQEHPHNEVNRDHQVCQDLLVHLELTVLLELQDHVVSQVLVVKLEHQEPLDKEER